ncbi:hypothetical protein [Yeosuana marina]|uniref:hypothetical protein n=1 Tax=Yeosuana marina TaxID=1565536 RepID=UPI00141ED8DE|nr:hypothetical protein [Yeosuana marina]
MSDTIQILLASSLLAGIVSAVISYWTSIGLKKLEFRNEYYKEILKKRLHAYEFIENQIAVMKAVALGDDNKPYHSLLGNGEKEFYKFQENLMLAISYSLWIDKKTNKTLEEINSLFFNIGNHIHKKSDFEIEQIGKKYYDRISELRMQLEADLRNGLYDLHDVKKIFKQKNLKKKRVIKKE